MEFELGAGPRRRASGFAGRDIFASPITIDGAQKLIHTSCTGEVTMSDILNHFKSLMQDPACSDKLHVLLDLTTLRSTRTPDQLVIARDAIGRTRQKVQFDTCAIVASSDLMFGLMRMFEVFAEGKFRATRTFRDVAAAKRWLNEQMGPQGR